MEANHEHGNGFQDLLLGLIASEHLPRRNSSPKALETIPFPPVPRQSCSWGGDGKLIFRDTFDRSESQEIKDEPGNNWTTSSDKNAKGHKQIDLRDGHVYPHPCRSQPRHLVSASVRLSKMEPSGFDFLFDDEDDALTLNFADLELKSVWAGHLFKVTVDTQKIRITDQKTGEMDLALRNAPPVR